MRTRRDWATLAVFLAIAALTFRLYLWVPQSSGSRFDWSARQNGYYNHLGRAFAAGSLTLPIEPDPKLLALANPYDPAVPDDIKMHDMAFFRGRYYLYHGPAPALLLFAPWRLATGRDLPENFALVLFCFAGFLFSAGALRRLLKATQARPSPILFSLLLLPLAAGQCLPYLLSRVWVYEIAIGAGWCCVSGGVYGFARAIESRRAAAWLAFSGAAFGLAIGCRPHLAFVAAAAFLALLYWLSRSRGWMAALGSRELAAFTLPVALGGAASAAYNFFRFGSPFEFGLRYLLSGLNQNRLRLAWPNIAPGLYYFLFCPPDLSPVFPWVEAVFRYPFDSVARGFPPEYFIEATLGALYLAPILPLALPVARARSEVRALLTAMAAAVGGVLLFLAATGFTTQRYTVDFLPLATLAASVNVGILLCRARPLARRVGAVALAVCILAGLGSNLALAISGPYEEFLKNRPRNYLRLARWFQPAGRHALVAGPSVRASFTAAVQRQDEGFREPLFSMGHRKFRYWLNLEHTPAGLRLASRTEASSETRDLGTREGPLRVAIHYQPEVAAVLISVDGREILRHRIGPLLTAPSEIKIGEAPRSGVLNVTTFTGNLSDMTVRLDYHSANGGS